MTDKSKTVDKSRTGTFDKILSKTDRVEKTEVDGKTVVTVYKKKRIILPLLLKMSVGLIVFIVTLFTIGLVMGFTGHRPPTMEWSVVENQWNKVTSSSSTPVNELSKIQDKPSPTPSTTPGQESLKN